MFRALIGRPPDDVEAAILGRLFDEQRALFAARGRCRRLLAVGDARADAALDRVDLAALTMVVSAIMNFDEFVVVR